MSSSGLSDALRDLASGEARPKSSWSEPAKGIELTPQAQQTPPPVSASDGSRPESPVQADAVDDESVIVGELDDSEVPQEPADGVEVWELESEARTPVAAPLQRRRRAAPPPRGSLKEVGIPIFITVGLLLLVPAIWGTSILLGFEVWRHNQPRATTVAALMQVCYPIALILIAYAGLLWSQVRSSRARSGNGQGSRR